MPLQNPQDVAAHSALTTGIHGLPDGFTPYANELTRQLFIQNPATGDFSLAPAKLNDGDGVDAPGTNCAADTIDQYAEVDFGAAYKIKQWRQYGADTNNGDGAFTIEYYDGTWHEWKAGISTRTTGNWSAWSPETVVIATKIRVVCTAVDTGGSSVIGELQITYIP